MSERLVIRTTGQTGPSGGGGGGGGTLDDLTDVTITAASAGDILRHNGTAWVDAVGTTHFEAAGGISTHAAVTSGVHGISAFGATLVDDADASAARTTLGLVIGTNVQAQDAELAAIAGLTSAADRLPYFTGLGTAALATFTAAGRALVDDADATAQRATLGIVAASDTASGIVELATTAETTTGTDTTRAVTAAGVKAVADLKLSLLAAGASVENVGAVEAAVNTVAATGATETLDVSLRQVHDCTMDQNCTFTFSNPAPSGQCSSFVLILRGAFTPTLPAAIDWSTGAAPTYTTPSMYTFTTVDAGTTWLGAQVGRAFA